MVKEVVVEAESEAVMAGSSSAPAAPAGTDQLDLEAAEQLIQLSGGADDDAGSESRSADSVKQCSVKKDKEAAAVESRMRSTTAGTSPVAAATGKDGDGEPDSSNKGAESFACSTAAGGEEEEKDKAAAVVEGPRRRAADVKDRDGGIVHDEERKRPKFRSLAAIYRETEKRRMAPRGGGGEGQAEDERKKKRTKDDPRRRLVLAYASKLG